MRRRMALPLALAVVLSMAIVGCGEDDEGFDGVDGPLVFASSCVGCHAADGSNVTATTAAEVDAALANVPEMAALDGTLSAEEVAAAADYLATDGHSDGWRDEDAHGGYAEDRGVDLCQECHGVDLTGTDMAPSCFLCHGKKW